MSPSTPVDGLDNGLKEDIAVRLLLNDDVLVVDTNVRGAPAEDAEFKVVVASVKEVEVEKVLVVVEVNGDEDEEGWVILNVGKITCSSKLVPLARVKAKMFPVVR